MNYWSAEMTNLDVTQPLFDYFQVSIYIYLFLALSPHSPTENMDTKRRIHRTNAVQHIQGLGYS